MGVGRKQVVVVSKKVIRVGGEVTSFFIQISGKSKVRKRQALGDSSTQEPVNKVCLTFIDW